MDCGACKKLMGEGVILNEDSVAPTRVVEGVLQPVAPTTAEQKNKADLEEQSLDDLFNNIKIYEAEVKSSSSTGTVTQNIAFVSSSNTNSTTESVSAAASVSAVCAKMHVSSLPNVDSLTEEEPANYALMAFSSSSSSSDNEVLSCSKAYAQLHSQYDKLTADFCESQFDVISYQIGLEFVEARLLVYKQNESVFEENIKLLNIKVQLRDNSLVTLRQKLKKAKQERDDLKLKLEKFQTSFKNLTELLASQTNEKTGLGYNSQVFTRAMFDGDDHLSSESDERTFMPPKHDLVFNIVPTAIETDHHAFNVQLSPTKPEQDLSPIDRPTTPIIEDWHTETSILVATPKETSPKPTSNGTRRNRKACFVCKILDHLIKDCDYHEKKMAKPTARNHAHRGNHKHYTPITHQNPQKQMVTQPRHATPIVTKIKSPIRRYLSRSLSPKTSNLPPRETAVKAPLGNPQHALKDKEIIDSRCSRNMTGNMSYLSIFELNGGYVAFGEKAREEIDQQYVLFPVWSSGSTNPQNIDGDTSFDGMELEFDEKKPESKVNVSLSSNAQSKKQDNKTKKEAKGKKLEDITYSDVKDDVGAEADFNNLETSIIVSHILTSRVYKDHPVTQIIGDLSSTTQTRSMTKVVKDQGGLSQMFNDDFHTCMFSCFLSQEEPKRVHRALKDPSWIEAMQEELLQFKMQKVWILVDLPYGKRAIGTQWVFRNKKDERGIVVRNKARLVTQGHTQKEGIDYEEVFAPVARIEAIRLFLAYASFMGFVVYEMDVKSAFLYVTIEKEVYVYQPPGFEDPDDPDKFYKVVKALYGLHQALRAWTKVQGLCGDTYQTFLPPKPDLVFNNAPNGVETDHSAFTVKLSPTKPAHDLSHTIRPSPPIIEDQVSDSEDEFESKAPQIVPIVTQSKPVHFTIVRPVSTDVPKIKVTRPRHVTPIVIKTNSPIRRHITHSPSPKASNSPPRVTTVKAPVVNAAQGNPKGGKISGKGKIRTRKLDFDDAYFVKELKFNIFSVSQMCDKKNSVLFTHTECLILSLDFKLLDESQVLLRVPRETICTMLEHINFKTVNKLVKGTFVRGLPTKVFANDNTCVSCKKGKQHRASCKTKPVSSVDQPLYRLHMDLFGPTFVKSLNKKSYCLVVTDDYRRFTWVFFLAIKDETSPILKTFITGLENQLSLKVKVIRSDNGTEFKNNDLNQFCRMKGIQYSLGKFDAKVDEGFLVGYSNTDGDVAFDRKKPESKLIISLSNNAQSKKQDDKTKKEAKGKSHIESFTGYRNLSTEFEDFSDNSINEVNATELEDNTYSDDDNVGAEADFNNLETSITVSPIPTTRVHKDHLVTQIIGDLSSATQTRSITRVAKDQGGLSQINNEDFHTCTKWVFMNKKDERGIVVRNKARFVAQGHTHEDGNDYEEVFAPVSKIEAIRLFLAYASFMGFMVYQMDVKSAFLYKTIEEEVYVCQPLGFKDPDHPDKVYKVVKALYDLHQAPRAWYETLANYLLENGFQRVQQKKDGIFISHDKYVAEILRKFGLLDGKSASTLIDTEKPLLKDPDVAVKKVNDVIRLQALVDKKKVVVTEATIREGLRLDDAEGVECLPNEEMFAELARMGYEKPFTKITFYKAFFSSQWKFLIHTILQCMSAKRTSWNEFSSSMASAVIYLSSGRKFNFSKKQVSDLSTHTTKYTSPALTQKVFVNIRRVGKGFSRVETPLFEGMLVEQQVVEEGDADANNENVNAGDAAEGDVSAA
nr:putative ribonuclease H-like domain-containing protein [Tanacetum cinerariifolium]